MDERIRKPAGTQERDEVSLGALMHQHVRLAIEMAVHEELRAALGASRTSATAIGVATGTARRRAP
jgi:hypothetical protein